MFCLGVLCNCVLPPRFNETKVRRVVNKGELSEEERKKRRNRSRSGPLLSTSSSSSTPDSHRSHMRAKSIGNPASSSSSSSCTSGSKKSKNQCAPPPTAPRAPDQKSPSVGVKTWFLSSLFEQFNYCLWKKDKRTEENAKQSINHTWACSCFVLKSLWTFWV